ncbi:MAG: hypothetical protein R2911_36195 [Caldilineaceae bacterium]
MAHLLLTQWRLTCFAQAAGEIEGAPIQWVVLFLFICWLAGWPRRAASWNLSFQSGNGGGNLDYEHYSRRYIFDDWQLCCAGAQR